jgi:hypothetical protein
LFAEKTCGGRRPFGPLPDVAFNGKEKEEAAFANLPPERREAL